MDCLVDTGSCVTLLKGTVFDQICAKLKYGGLLQKGPRLQGVNKNELKVRGKTELKFDFCEPIEVVIVDDEVPDCILGIDFFKKATAKLLVGEKKIVLFDHTYSCRSHDSREVMTIQNSTGSEEIDDVLQQYDDVFSTDSRKLGQCFVEPCQIPTGQSYPIGQKPYRLPLEKKKVVEEQMEEMLKAGMI